MKTPCEVIVWYLLPTIRKDLAIEMIATHGYSQRKAAQTLGVTDAAVSQYIRSKRAKLVIDNEQYIEHIKASAKVIVDDGLDSAVEMCKICGVVTAENMLSELYKEQGVSDGCYQCHPP